MFLRRYIFLLSCKQVIGKELFLNIFKAYSRNGIGKAFACNSLLAEQENCLFDHLQHLFLIGKDFFQVLTSCNLFAPPAANINTVAVSGLFKCLEGAFADTASAMVAQIAVDNYFSVNHRSRIYRAVVDYLAGLAASALVVSHFGHTLTDNAKVVKVGLNAVVGTAAHCDFELMGQFNVAVTLEEALVDFFG